MKYVVYDVNGNLTGAYQQDLLPEHQPVFIEVSDIEYANWVNFQANPSRTGLDPKPVTPPTPPTPQQTQQTASQRIQTLLDSTAQEHGYDNIISLCSYTTSKNLTWQKEGQYGVDFRDACWGKAEEIQNAVLAGTIPLPTVDQVLAQMPAVVWPV